MKKLFILLPALFVGCSNEPPREVIKADAVKRMEKVMSIPENDRYEVDASSVQVHRWPVGELRGQWDHRVESNKFGQPHVTATYEVLAKGRYRSAWKFNGRGSYIAADDWSDCLFGYLYDHQGNLIKGCAYYNGEAMAACLPLDPWDRKLPQALAKPAAKPVMYVDPAFRDEFPEALAAIPAD